MTTPETVGAAAGESGPNAACVPAAVPALDEWVIVRTTRSSGVRWFLGKPGQYTTRNPAKAQVYSPRSFAEKVAEQDRRDCAYRGNGVSVSIEPAPSFASPCPAQAGTPADTRPAERVSANHAEEERP